MSWVEVKAPSKEIAIDAAMRVWFHSGSRMRTGPSTSVVLEEMGCDMMVDEKPFGWRMARDAFGHTLQLVQCLPKVFSYAGPSG